MPVTELCGIRDESISIKAHTDGLASRCPLVFFLCSLTIKSQIYQQITMRKKPRNLTVVGKVGAIYTTPTGRKRVGVAENCKGVTAWRQISPARREPVHYGIIPPHQ